MMSTSSSSSSTRGTSVTTVASSLPSTSVVASATTGLPPTLSSTFVDEVAGRVLQSLLRSASALGGSRAGPSRGSGSTAVPPASSSPPVSSGSTGALGMLPLLFFCDSVRGKERGAVCPHGVYYLEVQAEGCGAGLAAAFVPTAWLFQRSCEHGIYTSAWCVASA
jgi:hypothetical protein